jgi:FAD/FMN-containing dehydrogenase
MSDDFLDVVIGQSQTILSPMAIVLLAYVHGAASRIDPHATSFGLRSNQWDFDIISQWTDPVESAVHVQWTRQFWDEVEKYTSGVYVNHLAGDEPQRVTAAFGPNYERLVDVKTRYDPSNLFRLNHNIQPRT